jgi:hypothetical protein
VPVASARKKKRGTPLPKAHPPSAGVPLTDYARRLAELKRVYEPVLRECATVFGVTQKVASSPKLEKASQICQRILIDLCGATPNMDLEALEKHIQQIIVFKRAVMQKVSAKRTRSGLEELAEAACRKMQRTKE